MLGDVGWHVNHKRVERIWKREGLKVPQKQPKRARLWLNDGSCVRLRPERPNHVWSYGQGACLFSKRLERGRFVWPSIADGKLTISTAQLAMMLEGIDWRAPLRTWRPLTAG